MRKLGMTRTLRHLAPKASTLPFKFAIVQGGLYSRRCRGGSALQLASSSALHNLIRL